jgi:hypothetical protein
MRTPIELHRLDVPSWSLWLVAGICFGPLILVWFLGVLLVPVWVGLIIAGVSAPEHFSHESHEAIWPSVSAIAYVFAGGIGLAGLLRVLTLPRERPKRHRVYTIGIVAVGLAALLLFDLPSLNGVLADFLEGGNTTAFLVYVGLPFTGAAWLLVTSWPFLLAGPVEPGRERRERTVKREHRDDWRLDA